MKDGKREGESCRRSRSSNRIIRCQRIKAATALDWNRKSVCSLLLLLLPLLPDSTLRRRRSKNRAGGRKSAAAASVEVALLLQSSERREGEEAVGEAVQRTNSDRWMKSKSGKRIPSNDSQKERESHSLSSLFLTLVLPPSFRVSLSLADLSLAFSLLPRLSSRLLT